MDWKADSINMSTYMYKVTTQCRVSPLHLTLLSRLLKYTLSRSGNGTLKATVINNYSYFLSSSIYRSNGSAIQCTYSDGF